MPAKFSRSNSRLWMILAAIFFLTTIALLIAVIVLAVGDDDDDGTQVCGDGANPNGYSVDLGDPDDPDVFHDLTENELLKLRAFLEKDPQIKAAEAGKAELDSSYIFTADLFLPAKSEVLRYLDQQNGQQPERQARAMIFRGDLSPPTVEEYICGPLPEVEKCEVMNIPGRRNPVEFSLRPFNMMEFGIIIYKVYEFVEKEIGYILKESYQVTFFECDDDGICMSFTPSPFGTELSGGISRRRLWLTSNYNPEFRTVHPLDFAVLLNVDAQNSTSWSLEKIWYAGRIYDSTDELIKGYNASSIPVSQVTKPVFGPQLFSTLMLKGDPMPEKAQRPPKLVEPDGKRYSVKHQKVEYMDWSFHFRMSSYSGPAVFDVRFRGERIVYELALQELSVFYSAHAPHPQTTNYVDSIGLLGVNSKALVPGADCPETATFIPLKFMAQYNGAVTNFPLGMCIFEQNDGTPLRRKLSYDLSGFFGGQLNSALVLRSIIAIGNYDYVVDFIFYQTGAIETKVLSTGYLSCVYFADTEKKYAFQIHDNLGGSLHHHMVHFKADVDVSGTSNRYETLDFSNDDVSLTAFPSQSFQVNKFSRMLKGTEQEALYNYNFDTPKYHVIHNNARRTKFNEIKAYRLQMNGMSKQLLTEGQYNEKSIPWARKQLVVTKHKDHEFWSSSNYAQWDSADPVVDFSQFYADNDNITDEDLVLWISMGMHHLPHSEDLPVTTTVGNGLSFYLLPYNYFPVCPSASSRDTTRVTHKDPQERAKGVVLTRYHDDEEAQCKLAKSSLADDLEEDPDSVIQSKKPSTVF